MSLQFLGMLHFASPLATYAECGVFVLEAEEEEKNRNIFRKMHLSLLARINTYFGLLPDCGITGPDL